MTSLVSTGAEKNHWRYAQVEGHWDEAVLPSGFPRRHWRKILSAVGRMGFPQLSRPWQASQQLIQTNGISYNVSNAMGPVGHEHLWPMDPVPLVMSEKEWERIEQAVVQRATLLNAILLDLYGDQRLVRDRLIPAALLYANPHFLRPCFAIGPARGIYLHTYAVDLARSPNGRWWVIADRTQAPSGMGYTLQNRLVSARTLPNLFNQCQVRQLTRFFDMRRDALLALAGSRRENPGVVVLSPGPHNETYFEHSFLAAQWGFPLVEGADLTVRDRHVYLKTLGGLKQVDLILRRLDDSFCDPLELRGDSLLGVPGLVDAVRSGSVVIDNALGSGLVETPAHMAFLPGLCRQLLDEELKMPSVATWWCGQDSPRRYVVEHLDELVVKPTFPRFGRHPEFPSSMSAAETRLLIDRIEAQPEEFVAQERIALSTAPVRTENGFEPRHVVLRVYAVWNGQSYAVMPGGLTRVSTEETSLVVSIQFGGGSKDTWVIGGSEEPAPLRRSLPVSIEWQPNSGNLPSGVADNLFWLGRYTERVESRVRLIRALLPALSGEEDFGRGVSLETATSLLEGLGYAPAGTSSTSIGEQMWLVQRLLTEMVYDPSQMSSLRWNVKAMRRVAWHLKERLSTDTWRVLQQLETQFTAFAPANADQRYLAEMDLLDGVIVTLSAFAGLLMENMTRSHGWRFLEIGRRLERALQTGELLVAGLSGSPAEIEPQLQILLQIADSSITYRTRYPAALQANLVLELLLADESNPRAVAFQLGALLEEMDKLPQHENTPANRVERTLALRTLAAVRNSRTAELSRRNGQGRMEALESLVEELRMNLQELSNALTSRYLSLSRLAPSRLTSSL